MPKNNVIVSVESNSIADELNIKPGDTLLYINGEQINDIFDYRYHINADYIELHVKKKNGIEFIAEIEKDFDEDLGIVFESALMDNAKSCKNKCIFCFIDQLPKNLRQSLYFKDDDSRLSFLTGNYVTLTNMSDSDIDRIVFYHFSPINISVHATDKDVRASMLKNPNAANILSHINRLTLAGIELNYQVVLCKGINDGAVLDKTIDDLSKYIPKSKSLSVVPVGLTKFRHNLFDIKPFSKSDAIAVIKQVQCWQQKLLSTYGFRFVYLADEFYLQGGINIPSYFDYDDFPQLENGVGMLSLFEWEFNEYLDNIAPDNKPRSLSIATGVAAYNFIIKLCNKLTSRFINTKINVYCIKNNFFGERITVSGLLCGKDIVGQLKGKALGDKLLIPSNAFRTNTTTFLDDLDIDFISHELEVAVTPSGDTGDLFVKSVLEEK